MYDVARQQNDETICELLRHGSFIARRLPARNWLAVEEAIQRIRNLYHEAHLNDDDGECYQREADHGSKYVTWSICSNAWNLAWQFSETDVRHDALASLIAALKKAAPPAEFDPKDPQLVFADSGLEEVTYEQFERGYVRNISPDEAGEELVRSCYRSIRSFAFRAKLLTNGVLDISDSKYVCRRMNDYLIKDESVNDLAWSARIATAAQPVLFSGEALVGEAKQPTQKHWHPLDAKKWQSFAKKLKTESLSDRQDRWCAKDKAARAYARMLDLWPEAFDT